MHQHAPIVNRDQTVRLIAVRQKRARHRLADNQADHRMSSQARFGIGASCAGKRLMNAERLFASTVGLARHVDDRDNRALHVAVFICVDGFIHHLRQRPALQQPDFAARGARVVVVCIGHHGDQTYALAVEFAVSHLNGVAQAAQALRIRCQFFQPGRTAADSLGHYLSSRAKSCLICAVSAC